MGPTRLPHFATGQRSGVIIPGVVLPSLGCGLGRYLSGKDPNEGNTIQSESDNDRKGKRIKDGGERKTRKGRKGLAWSPPKVQIVWITYCAVACYMMAVFSRGF
jgi:hypothetical protein